MNYILSHDTVCWESDVRLRSRRRTKRSELFSDLFNNSVNASFYMRLGCNFLKTDVGQNRLQAGIETRKQTLRFKVASCHPEVLEEALRLDPDTLGSYFHFVSLCLLLFPRQPAAILPRETTPNVCRHSFCLPTATTSSLSRATSTA